jgi:hypothetical protein
MATPSRPLSQPPTQQHRSVTTRSLSSLATVEDKEEEKKDDVVAVATPIDGDAKRSGPRLQPSSLSLTANDEDEEKKSRKTRKAIVSDEDAKLLEEAMARLDFGDNSSDDDEDAEEHKEKKSPTTNPSSRKKKEKKNEQKSEEEEDIEHATKKMRIGGQPTYPSIVGNHVLQWYACPINYTCDHCGEYNKFSYMCSSHGKKCEYVECLDCHDSKDDEVNTAKADKWTRELQEVPEFPYYMHHPGPIGVNTTDPYELFSLFITKNDIKRITQATNAHGTNKYQNLKVPSIISSQSNTHLSTTIEKKK